MKLLSNKPAINMNSLEIENVDLKDYPDFVDAFIASGEYVDGTKIEDAELDLLNENSDLVLDLAFDLING